MFFLLMLTSNVFFFHFFFSFSISILKIFDKLFYFLFVSQYLFNVYYIMAINKYTDRSEYIIYKYIWFGAQITFMDIMQLFCGNIFITRLTISDSLFQCVEKTKKTFVVKSVTIKIHNYYREVKEMDVNQIGVYQQRTMNVQSKIHFDLNCAIVNLTCVNCYSWPHICMVQIQFVSHIDIR